MFEQKTNIFLCTKNNNALQIVHIYVKVNNGFRLKYYNNYRNLLM